MFLLFVGKVYLSLTDIVLTTVISSIQRQVNKYPTVYVETSRLKNDDYSNVLQNEDTSLLSSIHVMLIEHIIQCRLVQGTVCIAAYDFLPPDLRIQYSY
jgi:hypothetical protein